MARISPTPLKTNLFREGAERTLIDRRMQEDEREPTTAVDMTPSDLRVLSASYRMELRDAPNQPGSSERGSNAKA